MSRKSPKRWILVTGLSGAGKTTALKILEDLGYYTIDNLPAAMIPALIAASKEDPTSYVKLVLGMDLRGKNDSAAYSKTLKALKQAGIQPEVIFLESRADALVRRFSESRRPHPLIKGRSLRKAIAEEKSRLAPIRRLATWVIESTDMNVHGMKRALRRRFAGTSAQPEMRVTLLSFGYKHGVPPEADLVIDVRFLDNPFFVPRLKNLDGKSASIQKFVWDQKAAQAFQRKFLSLLKFLLPRYRKEGKTGLVVAFGCTGGRHRSVAVVEGLFPKIKKVYVNLEKTHRDWKRGE